MSAAGDSVQDDETWVNSQLTNTDLANWSFAMRVPADQAGTW